MSFYVYKVPKYMSIEKVCDNFFQSKRNPSLENPLCTQHAPARLNNDCGYAAPAHNMFKTGLNLYKLWENMDLNVSGVHMSTFEFVGDMGL